MEKSAAAVSSNGSIAVERGDSHSGVCLFCSQSPRRDRIAMEYDETMDLSMSPRRYGSGRPPLLRDVHSSSPLSLRCSTVRSYEEEDDDDDDDDNGRIFWSPCSVFSQDVSDMDTSSFSTGNEFYNFKSLLPSPVDSPNKDFEREDQNTFPMSQKTDLNQGSLQTLSVSERIEGNQNEGTYSNECLPIYRDHIVQEAQTPVNVENNENIWLPPPPEDEYDDVENGYFGGDDEDDDVGHSGTLFPSSSFDIDELHTKEKTNDVHKDLLRSSVHRHFRALVCQLLKGEGIPVGNDDEKEGWLHIVSSLAWQAANFVRPDTSGGGSMDPGDYVKVKCILSGSPRESILVKGVVCTKNVKLKRMITQHRKPRLFLLGGSLEFQKVPNKLASIETILKQERDHLKMAVAKIEAHKPNVLLVEKSVSSYALECLHAKEISLVLNVKRKLLELISRCTGAQISPSIDEIASTKLGSCQAFRVEKVTEECTTGDQSNKKSKKTLMFFEGCPRRLGCTVLLRGTCLEELKKVKHVLKYASFAAYHLSLETSFLSDSGVTVPTTPQMHEVEDGMASASDSVSMIPDTVSNLHLLNKDEHQVMDSIGEVGTTYHSQELHVPLNCKASCDENGQEECLLLNDNSSHSTFTSSYYEEKEPGAQRLFTSIDKNYKLLCDGIGGELCVPPDTLDTGVRWLEVPEEGVIKNPSQSAVVHEERISSICVGTDITASSDCISASENQQSILVSFSSSCILKGIICEWSKLFRIKFYSNFDKPLGKYLREDLFDQTSYCQSCKESPEAHVKCFTHRHGSLTISVRRLLSTKLPGELDGRIWMWHRCLKCEHSDGVPPATLRVVMSDAAWGLSFGKFLELSFSNHATTNRAASCGHSLQHDCLRFFGFGSMVAFFRYSPVDILSIQLPPSVLEFACPSQLEWFERELEEVSSKVELLYREVLDVLHGIEQKIISSVHELSKASLCGIVMELKGLLKKERFKYDVLWQPSSVINLPIGKSTLDVLVLNYLRRCLLIDSYIWDRRIYLLDSKVKGSSSEIDAHLLEILSHSDLMHRSEPFSESASFSECEKHGLLPVEVNAVVVDNNLNESIGMHIVKMVEDEDHIDVAGGNEINMDCGAAVDSFPASLPSPGSHLSNKIDLAWSGASHPADIPTSNIPSSIQDKPDFRRLMSPARVYSFDSALIVRDKIHRNDTIASLRLSSLRSFHGTEDHGGLVSDPTPNIRRAYSQCSPRGIGNLKFLFGHMPLFISSMSSMVNDGARLLLPQTGSADIVVAVYDKEPTSVIAYVLSSKEHADFVECGSDPKEGRLVNDQMKDGISNLWGSNVTAPNFNSNELGDIQAQHFNSDEAALSLGNISLDVKSCHFRFSFDDESSIPADKAKFFVTCYFAKQFDALRKKCCPNELDFICSLSRCRRWNAQGGKSNVYFAKSMDERFIIKQVTRTELDSFEDFASQYFGYMMESLNSGSPTCLAKILGIYQVAIKNLKGGREVRMDLMVMENLFYRRNISRVYDLKGSLRSRYNSDTTGGNKVMLDSNLIEALRTKPIFLGSKAKRSLERAIWNDTSFLALVDVMDYSLLVGVDEENEKLVVGIIDFLRQYTWDKHLESWVKASGILGGNASPTVISPKQYKKRFRKAMSSYFLTVPDQWPS